MKLTLEKKVLCGLALATVVIAAVAVVGHVTTTRMIESADGVSRCHLVIEAVTDLALHVQSARMATRGHLITGDPGMLRMYDEARAHVEEHLAGLRTITRSDPARLGRLEEIHALATARMADAERLLDLHRRHGRIVAGLAAATSYHVEVDDPLHERAEALIADVRDELRDRRRVARDSGLRLFIVLAFGAFIELAFAAVAAAAIRHELRERRRNAAIVEQKELMLRSFFDSGVTMMGIVELLEGDEILFVSDNAATSSFLGHTGSLVGMTASEAGLTPELNRMWVAHYRESLRVGGRVEFEYEHPTPSAGPRWLSVVICPIQNRTPTRCPRFSFVVLDVTARKAAEDALIRHTAALTAAKDALERQSAQLEQARKDADAANAAKSSFLANMSHEIRTPMTAVLGYSDLLAEPGRSDAERADWVAVIRRNARHLLELINDVLDLSKIEAGRMTLEAIACDPAQVLGDVVAMMRQRAADKGIALRLDVETPLPRQIIADPLRLRQVLVNLVGNAIKFTEAGEVGVRAMCDCRDGADCNTDPTAALQIAVRDTGIGMTPAQVTRLFRPFSQADETMTRRFGGTGLGLTITQRLVHLMGGEIEVQSEAGMGSTFTLTLPVVPVALDAAPFAEDHPATGAAAARADGVGVAPTANLTGGRILLAEDTPDTQRLVALLLRRAGADVTIVSTGREAMTAAEAQPFDVILMDMQMPQVDGYTAAAALRRGGVKTPIIAVTAHAMAGDRERCLAAGCTDYLTKPIDRAELLRRVASYLRPGGRGHTSDPRAA